MRRLNGTMRISQLNRNGRIFRDGNLKVFVE